MAIRSVEREPSFWMDLMLPTDQFSQSHKHILHWNLFDLINDTNCMHIVWMQFANEKLLFSITLFWLNHSMVILYFSLHPIFKTHFFASLWILPRRHDVPYRKSYIDGMGGKSIRLSQIPLYCCESYCLWNGLDGIDFFKKKNKTECCSLRMSAKKMRYTSNLMPHTAIQC